MYAYNKNKSHIQICKIKLHKITKTNSTIKGQKKIKRVAKDKENRHKQLQKKALLSQARLFRYFIITNLSN